MFSSVKNFSGFQKIFVSNLQGIQKARRNFGEFNFSSDGFISLKSREKKILQFSDIRFYNNRGPSDNETISLIGTITERVKPDLVVITGDVLDQRFNLGFRSFRNMISPLVDLRTPWTYLPGTGETVKAFPRSELINIFEMPYCLSKGQNHFTHLLGLGPLEVYLVDTQEEFNRNRDFISKDQLEWQKGSPFTKECGLTFLYSPKPKLNQDNVFVEKAVIENGKNGRWGKLVSDKDKVWMYHGLVSGLSNPVEKGMTSIERGGRVISFDSSTKILATWFETKKGIEKQTLIAKSFVQEGECLFD